MKKILLSLCVSIGLIAGVISPVTLASVTCPPGTAREKQPVDSFPECSTEPTGGDDALMPRVKTIILVVIGVLGVVAVAMIIFGGVQFTTSRGDPQKVTQAKNIILYSIIGLIVALLAFAIVNFVMDNVFK